MSFFSWLDWELFNSPSCFHDECDHANLYHVLTAKHLSVFKSEEQAINLKKKKNDTEIIKLQKNTR